MVSRAETIDPPAATLRVEPSGSDAVAVRLGGAWTLSGRHPPVEAVFSQLDKLGGDVRRLELDSSSVTGWDSALLTFLVRLARESKQRGIETDDSGLHEGVGKLLALAFAVPAPTDTGRKQSREPPLERVGKWVLSAWSEATEVLQFLGEALIAFGRLLVGKARFQRSELFLILQETGAGALGIVALISFLVGLILAYIGAVQLAMFGAEIYVANLVTIGMAREMACIMTAIVMAGRTGAAFAAQLGTMTVNEEIDSLRTTGISPMEFLVLPRMLALMLMMPLLCAYANLFGMLGGYVVGVGLLDITPALYISQTVSSMGLNHLAVGLGKGAFFGVLVAISGCLRGMQAGRSASAVGQAATSAVVTAIVLIIVSDAILAVVFNIIGI